MHFEIISEPLGFDIYGFSGVAMNNDHAETAFRLMDRMWQTVKTNQLKNKGINIWVYEQDQSLFAGVELNDIPNPETGLERKTLTLLKYASYTHIGPYHLIKQAGQHMREALHGKGYVTTLPYIEIYGHWTSDETKLKTRLLMSLK